MITEAQFQSFQRALLSRMGGRLINRESAYEMGLIGQLFDFLHNLGFPLPSREEFLSNFATTLGPMVYMPSSWDPQTKLITLVHEAEHVRQWATGEFEDDVGIDGHFDMAFLYLFNGQGRVRLEERAARAAGEFVHARRRSDGPRLPSIDEATRFLEVSYALGADDLQFSRDLATHWITEVGHGFYDTTAGRAAIEIAEQQGIFL